MFGFPTCAFADLQRVVVTLYVFCSAAHTMPFSRHFKQLVHVKLGCTIRAIRYSVRYHV